MLLQIWPRRDPLLESASHHAGRMRRTTPSGEEAVDDGFDRARLFRIDDHRQRKSCRRVWKSRPKKGISPDSFSHRRDPAFPGAHPSYLRFQTSMPTRDETKLRLRSSIRQASRLSGWANIAAPPFDAASASSSSVARASPRNGRSPKPQRGRGSVDPSTRCQARAARQPCWRPRKPPCNPPTTLVKATVVFSHKHSVIAPIAKLLCKREQGPTTVVGPVGMNVSGSANHEAAGGRVRRIAAKTVGLCPPGAMQILQAASCTRGRLDARKGPRE